MSSPETKIPYQSALQSCTSFVCPYINSDATQENNQPEPIDFFFRLSDAQKENSLLVQNYYQAKKQKKVCTDGNKTVAQNKENFFDNALWDGGYLLTTTDQHITSVTAPPQDIAQNVFTMAHVLMFASNVIGGGTYEELFYLVAFLANQQKLQPQLERALEITVEAKQGKDEVARLKALSSNGNSIVLGLFADELEMSADYNLAEDLYLHGYDTGRSTDWEQWSAGVMKGVDLSDPKLKAIMAGTFILLACPYTRPLAKMTIGGLSLVAVVQSFNLASSVTRKTWQHLAANASDADKNLLFQIGQDCGAIILLLPLLSNAKSILGRMKRFSNAFDSSRSGVFIEGPARISESGILDGLNIYDPRLLTNTRLVNVAADLSQRTAPIGKRPLVIDMTPNPAKPANWVMAPENSASSSTPPAATAEPAPQWWLDLFAPQLDETALTTTASKSTPMAPDADTMGTNSPLAWYLGAPETPTTPSTLLPSFSFLPSTTQPAIHTNGSIDTPSKPMPIINTMGTTKTPSTNIASQTAAILDNLGVSYVRQPGWQDGDFLIVSLDDLSMTTLCDIYEQILPLLNLPDNKIPTDIGKRLPLRFVATSDDLFLRLTQEIDNLIVEHYRGLDPQWLTDLQTAQEMLQSGTPLSAEILERLDANLQAIKDYEQSHIDIDFGKPLCFAKYLLFEQNALEIGLFMLNHDAGGKIGMLTSDLYDWAITSFKKGNPNIDFELKNLSAKYTQTADAEDKRLEKIFMRAVIYASPYSEKYGVHVNQSSEPSTLGRKIRLSATSTSSLVNMLVNLVTNACRYSNPELAEGQRTVDINTTLTTNGDLQIVVQDNGIGFAPENLKRVGNEMGFREARKEVEGSHGIGLYSVYETARKMGWTITLESTPGQGSKFKITIPAKDLIVAQES